MTTRTRVTSTRSDRTVTVRAPLGAQPGEVAHIAARNPDAGMQIGAHLDAESVRKLIATLTALLGESKPEPAADLAAFDAASFAAGVAYSQIKSESGKSAWSL